MMMSQSLHQTLRQTMELDPTGGASSSVFSKTEVLLFKSMEATDLQKSLKLLSQQKGCAMENYRSIMDWLYVSTFGTRAWRECMNFYQDKGPQLRELYSQKELDYFDVLLLGSIRVLQDHLFVRERWASFITGMQAAYANILHA